MGNMISKYIEAFKGNLDECLIFKSMIDFKFETYTRPFIRNQMIFYGIFFLIPFFMLLLGDLQGAAEIFCLRLSFFGASGMFFFEIMSMYVEGPRTYFKDKWNWVDLATFATYLTYYTIGIYAAKNQDASPEW
jgi:hypothetical protein